MDTTETWRDIPGFDGHYQVSDLGRVRSCKTTHGEAGLTWHLRAPQPLPPYGHLMLVLYRHNQPHTRYVHALVAGAFLGPCPPGHEVAHNDGNPADNRVQNLRYATRKENQADRLEHGTMIRGEDASNHKLTESDVRDIRAAWAARTTSRRALAERYGVSESAIQQIYLRKNWAWLT